MERPTYAENREAALVYLALARDALGRECEPEPTEHEAASHRSAMMYIGWAQAELAP